MKSLSIISVSLIIFILNISLVFGVDICFTNKDKIDLDNLNFQKEDQVYVNAWVKNDNTPAYYCFKEAQKDKIKSHIKLRHHYRVVHGNYEQRYRRNDKREIFSLLVAGGGDTVDPNKIKGWVSHDNLIFSKEPLRNDETNIYEKVLIRQGDMNSERGTGSALRIFKDPKRTIQEKEGIEVRSVFYVYDYYPHKYGDIRNPNIKSLLISPLSQLDPGLDIEPLLIGWVDRSKVTFWNTRIACEFPVNSKIELIHDTGKIIFDENKKPLPYNSLRNPILQEQGDYYRIGAFARLDTAQLHQRTQLEKITTGLEVLFVIDGTRSMTKAFKDTLRGVENVADYLEYKSRESNLLQPRFGLVFYRDEYTRSPVMIENGYTVEATHPDCRKEISLYSMSSIRRFKDVLKQQIACDSDRTSPESVYLGLVDRLDEVGFHKGKGGITTRVRVIIHIGDAGDNSSGKLSVNRVVSKLKEHSIYSYIAIDVSQKDNSPSFKSSVLPVVTRFGNMAEFIDHPYNLSESVSNKLTHFFGEAKKVKDQIDIISRGFAGTSEGSAGVFSQEILDLAKEIISANNIDLAGYNAFQQYVEGKVHKNTKLNKHVLVLKKDIENITFFLSQLIDTPDIENKRKAWEGILRLILGDETCTAPDGTELTLEECNKMIKGIPIKAGFMKHTKSQFLNLGYDQTKQVMCDARKVRERFRFLLADKNVKEIKHVNNSNCEFDVIWTADLNGNDKVVKDGNVYKQVTGSNKLDFQKKATDDDLIDKYFFKEGRESVAWIPLEHLGEIEKK